MYVLCTLDFGEVMKEVLDIITNIILDESKQWKLVRELDLYTEKPVKFKKAICSFIFLFFITAQI